jgi:site-specific recombinase XerD
MQMSKKYLSDYLTDYLTRYLPLQIGASPNTIRSYRDAFIVFLRYCRDELKIKPEKLTMDQISRKMVEVYLLWLEENKGCAVSTRNHRLTVIHALMRYIAVEDPRYMSKCQEILGIDFKKCAKREVEYLTVDELKIIFEQPDSKRKNGQRDLTMLSLLYDSGARVQELVDLKLKDIRFTKPATVTLTGKGNKARIVPLMPDTGALIEKYTSNYGITVPDQYLFVNKMKQKLTRSGVEYVISKYVAKAQVSHPEIAILNVTPHIFRHSKAMHLVQANVNLIYIRDFLGHESVKTTEIYAKADSAAKREALEKASEKIIPESRYKDKKREELLDWLKEMI